MSVVSRNSNSLMKQVIIQRFAAAAMGPLGIVAMLLLAQPLLIALRTPEALALSMVVMRVMGLVLLVMGVISGIVGMGLVRRSLWARWAEILLSAMQLFAFPIGTLIGGFVLYYLFSEAGQAQFEV